MGEQLDLFKDVNKQLKKITKKRKQRSDSLVTNIEHALLEHKRVINQLPPKSFILKNKNYGNDYIPLEILEMALRAIFLTYEPRINQAPFVVEGNIMFFVDVVVTNPATLEKETYTGVSAVPIMPEDGKITDVHPHIPAGYSFAIMNACKHIGRLFRAENSDVTKIFDSYFEDKQKKKDPKIIAKENMKRRLLEMIAKSETVKSLDKKWDQVFKLDDEEVNMAYDLKYNSLS